MLKKMMMIIMMLFVVPTEAAFALINSPLTISIDTGYAPMTFLNADGEPAGLFIDIWRLWSEKTGHTITFQPKNWSESIQSIRDGSADVHSGLFYSDERAAWMDFSQPFYQAASYYFYPSVKETGWLADELDDKKIGAVKGSYQEAYLRKIHPTVDIFVFAGREKMIRATLDGDIHGFLAEHHPVNAALNRLGLTGKLKKAGSAVFTKEIHAGVPRENRDLLTLIDKGFDAISENELAGIEAHWIPNPDLRYFKPDVARIRLTAAEKAWLAEHPVIRLGLFKDIEPAMFVGEDGAMKGIVKELTDIIGRRAGVRFERVPISLTMIKDLAGHVEKGNIDVFPGFESPGRRKWLGFTNPFYSVSWVIVTRNTEPFMSGLRDVEALDMKLAWIENGSLNARLTAEYPNIQTVPVSAPLQALQSISFGGADATVIGLDVAGYLIRKHGLHNLKIAAPAGYPDSVTRLAVGKDMPELTEILNKGIASIDRREKDVILQKWLPVRYDQGVDMVFVRNVILAIVSGFTILLLASLFWNRQLKREVRERRRAEASLRKAEKELRLILDTAPAMIWQKDGDGKYMQVNKMYCRTVGIPASEILGKTDHELFPPDIADKYIRDDLKLFQSGAALLGVEERHKKASGEYGWSLTDKFLYRDEAGHVSGAIGFALDITDRKKAEMKLQEYSQHLEEMVEARTRELTIAQTELTAKERLAVLGHFAGNISHELRNPLGAIDASAYFLNMKLGAADKKIQAHIGRIRANIEHSNAIIHSLLNLSRMEKPKTTAVELADFISTALSPLKIPEAFEIVLKLPDGPVMIDMDSEQMRMALKNIILNAVQAMGEEGKLTISGGAWASGEATISITDNGPGISPEHVEKVFEPLFSTKTHGIGFGLSITKMIVENHGGTIRAESPAHGGARFVLTLPIGGKGEISNALPA